MLNRRPLTALLCTATLAAIIVGCGTSAPQAATTTAPAPSTSLPATAAPAPVASSPPSAAPTATAPASPTLAPTATAGAGADATVAATTAASPPALGGASSAVPQATIDAMIADLAKMTGVDPSQITVVSAEAVTWRDGSLGCPRPGMMYPQVLTDGYRVVLAAGGKEYAYHGSDRGTYFYCANPSQ